MPICGECGKPLDFDHDDPTSLLCNACMGEED